MRTYGLLDLIVLMANFEPQYLNRVEFYPKFFDQFWVETVKEGKVWEEADYTGVVRNLEVTMGREAFEKLARREL